jgi:16S rRNA (cytosine967-C5)-methyltransferase
VERRPLDQSRFPRALAVRVLTRVLSDGEPLDEALAAMAGGVTPDARAWLQEICARTLRWKGRIDFVLDEIALKKKPSGWLRKILSIAVYQLLAQERVHPGPVVSETVSEVKRKEGRAPAQFANALLRKVADHTRQWLETELDSSFTPGRAAQWASVPEWLWKRLVMQHGQEWAKAFALACLERPSTWVRAKSTVPGQDEWIQPGPIPNAWKVFKGGALSEKPGFSDGEFFVQDISSQWLVAEISNEVKTSYGEHPSALDLCAAPGGKTAGLAWNQFCVTATDREDRRLQLLEDTVKRVAPDVRIIPREQVSDLQKQDLVWVDAPCTGTGIIRRHPDVRWLRRESEIPDLLKLQQELIREGWQKVRPGGFFAYSVCSVLKDEGPEAIERARLAGEPIKEWFLVPQFPPGGDGFWAVLIRKTGE